MDLVVFILFPFLFRFYVRYDFCFVLLLSVWLVWLVLSKVYAHIYLLRCSAKEMIVYTKHQVKVYSNDNGLIS